MGRFQLLREETKDTGVQSLISLQQRRVDRELLEINPVWNLTHAPQIAKFSKAQFRPDRAAFTCWRYNTGRPGYIIARHPLLIKRDGCGVRAR